MKNKDLIFLIFCCLAFLMGCSEFDMTDNDLDNAQMKKASAVPVFVVEPSGGDDTPAILQAFMDAKDAGPGSAVRLAEGEYHLGFLEIRDFYGSFMGAGKDKTIIKSMNNLDAQALFDQNMYHDLVKFVGGDVHISDFTLCTPEGPLTITGLPTGHIRSLIHFSATNAQYELGNESRYINVVINNVSFKGQYYDEGMGFYYHTYNCMFGVCADFDVISTTDLPRENINFKITNSGFDTFCYGLALQAIKNSVVIVGEKNKGNVFNNCEQSGGVWECRGMKTEVAGNTFNVPEYGWGFDHNDYPYYGLLKNEPETKTSTCNIHDNIFNLTHSDYGIYLRNQRHFTNPGEQPVAYQVRNNRFIMTDGWPWGIYSQVTKDMVIRNNKFSGYGYDALCLDLYSTGGLILGNNFSTAEFYRSSVILLATTQGCTIVGGNVKDNVIDLGVDNIITGVNVSTSVVPLGRIISEKIPAMNHLMH